MTWPEDDIDAYLALRATLQAQPRPSLQDRPLQPRVYTLGGEHRGEPLPTDEGEE